MVIQTWGTKELWKLFPNNNYESLELSYFSVNFILLIYFFTFLVL